MRYKDGEIPPEILAINASNDMLLFTAVISMMIGIVFFFFGRRGKQLWIWTWGIGLILCSLYLWFTLTTGIKIFGYF
ncbi:MAG: hypothetical protein AAF402_00070 [Pseudomonadota bacterium]